MKLFNVSYHLTNGSKKIYYSDLYRCIKNWQGTLQSRSKHKFGVVIYNEETKLWEPKPTKMTLTLADLSVTYPYGVLEDVLVKVDDLLFPDNFIILDTPKDTEAPLLSGRHFLATGRALINMERGELVLWFNKEQVIFDIFEAMNHTQEHLQCYQINLIDELIENVSKEKNPSSPMENVLVQSIKETVSGNEHEKVNKVVLQLQATHLDHAYKKFEELRGVSEEKPIDPKLKELLEHLKYVFLSLGHKHPAITSSTL